MGKNWLEIFTHEGIMKARKHWIYGLFRVQGMRESNSR